MRDMKNRVAVRRKAKDLHTRLEDSLFALYLYFLQPNLDILADINHQLQKANQSLLCCVAKLVHSKQHSWNLCFKILKNKLLLVICGLLRRL